MRLLVAASPPETVDEGRRSSYADSGTLHGTERSVHELLVLASVGWQSGSRDQADYEDGSPL